MIQPPVPSDNHAKRLSTTAAPSAPVRHTPGPWGWFGNQHGIYLATDHSGRRYVMAFRRMGTQGAQPTFQVAHRMTPAAELVEFEVGDGAARGFSQAKADPSVYRYDVSGIDCPDARLIVAAPDLLAALERLGRDYAIAEQLSQEGIEQARAAIAKATGDGGMGPATHEGPSDNGLNQNPPTGDQP